MTSWRRLSDDFGLVRINLTVRKHEAELCKIEISVLDPGETVGVVRWMKLDLGSGIEFSNHPDGCSDGGWLQVLNTFPRPIVVSKGDQLEPIVGHDRAGLIVAPLMR